MTPTAASRENAREAPDLAASEALDSMDAAVQEFITATRQAFQQEVPEPDAWPAFAPEAGAAAEEWMTGTAEEQQGDS